MASRYSELYRLPSRLYLDEAPVIIEAGALLKDTQTNQVIAQFKIKNLSEKKVIACKISVDAFEPSGKNSMG